MLPFYLPSGSGQRFCVYHAPKDGNARGALLYIHPFAEEMNKARRMAARQARQFAESGFAVLQIDLLGCGDSSGDFGDASWAAWKEDVLLGYSWLRQQTAAPLTLWGLRAGCLLAAEAAVDLPEPPNFVFWQPVLSGKQHWQQFMRLKMAGELASGQAKGVTEQLRKTLANGLAVEIAGYTVSPSLVSGLEASELTPLMGVRNVACLSEAPLQKNASDNPRVAWIELSVRENPALAPTSQKRTVQWLDAGYSVDTVLVNGPAFWQTTEIEDANDLISATVRAVESVS